MAVATFSSLSHFICKSMSDRRIEQVEILSIVILRPLVDFFVVPFE